MEPTKKTARLAGLLYLILIISGVLALVYIPSQVIVWDNASATYTNLQASETLFRWSVIGVIICFTVYVVLPLVLYRLLKDVNKMHAVLMVILALVSVPISFVNLLHYFEVLTLTGDSEYLKAFELDYRQSQVMLLLTMFNHGNLVAHIFWGLWLYPLGYLVYKSGFLPKFLGVFLMVGCFGYLIDFGGYFFFPDYGDTLFSTIVGIPSVIGEFGICLWLLIVGIHRKTIKKGVVNQEPLI